MSGRRIALGNAGERLAERFLAARGWTILDRKWRGVGGEIDLVALDGDVLVVVEVKTRRGRARGAAEEGVDDAKTQRLLSLGEQYVAEHPEHEERYWRVDLIAITLGLNGAVERLTHIPDACQTG